VQNPIRWIKPRFTKLGYQVIAERVTIPEKITDDETGYNNSKDFGYSIHFDNFQFCPKLNKNFRPIQQINKSVYKAKKVSLCKF
jgi:hypothetical protein